MRAAVTLTSLLLLLGVGLALGGSYGAGYGHGSGGYYGYPSTYGLYGGGYGKQHGGGYGKHHGHGGIRTAVYYPYPVPVSYGAGYRTAAAVATPPLLPFGGVGALALSEEANDGLFGGEGGGFIALLLGLLAVTFLFNNTTG